MTLLSTIPIVLALILLRGGPVVSGSMEEISSETDPISISIEAPMGETSIDPQASVVFPGYLLPDDGSKDSPNAGG